MKLALSRETKAMLIRRVRRLQQLYAAEVARANALCDETVLYTAERPIRTGETVMVRVPRRFVVR